MNKNTGILIFGCLFAFFLISGIGNRQNLPVTEYILPSLSPTPEIVLKQAPAAKILENDYHIFQTFNNCGPAALSMALSYYDIFVSQQDLGLQLRPWQNPQGNNDDKSVTLEELAQKGKEFGLVPYHRPNGTIELIKQFIVLDIPVIIRTVTAENEDIGHYRIIRGYDDENKQIIQDDSLQGQNLKYSYLQLNRLWQKFNYEYLVLLPENMHQEAKIILGSNAEEKESWQNAILSAEEQLESNPDDIFARFNLSVALYHSGEYSLAAVEFEKVENSLPFRTLWYQIEPIKAYMVLADYDRVLYLTDKILNGGNRAFSELYILRSEIFLRRADNVSARRELEKAVLYNANLQSAQRALAELEEKS